jgi:hypothetical protein
MGDQKWVETASGHMEQIDCDTGDVLARQKTRKPPRSVRIGGRGPGRPSKGELLAKEAGMPIRVQLYPYDPGLGELVCQAIVSGHKVTTLEQTIGVPYQAICQWRREHVDFDRRLRESLESRALAYEEKAIEAAENVIDKDDVPAARLRFDAYKKAAEWNDPSRYANKVTVEGNNDRPVQFIISTGFGEPNEWQRPPKIGSDGLIIRDEKNK